MPTNHTAQQAAPAKPARLLRLPLVEERTGLKKTSIYTALAAGTFPVPVRLHARAVAWREADIDAWIESRTDARAAK